MTDPSARDEAMALLERSGALRRGHFVLSSGLHSDRYCQCAALFERPEHGARVAALMASSLPESMACDAVLAPALGGVLWGYALAGALGVRSLFAERAGPERAFALRRGFSLRPGDRVLLAEDVVTTGGSVMELVPLVEGAGASVAGIAAVVDRSAGRFGAGAAARFGFRALVELAFGTWPEDGLPPELAAIPVESPGSRRDPA